MPMNDRFKFRTYIPDLNFFKYWGWIDKGHFVGFCASGDYSTDELLEKYTQQCTGLKDKQGTLIYEGDIVKDDNDAWHYVKWVYDSWQLFPCTQNNYTIGIVDDEIEVIGNIYENKSLLESEG